MLSNKWTFSLKVLVLLLMIGFVAPAAMAQVKVTVTGMTSVQRSVADRDADPLVSVDTDVQIIIETDKNTAVPTLTARLYNRNGLEVVTDPVTDYFPDAAQDASMNTGMKKYITARVPLAQIVADNLPLRLIVTIPAIGPSDPSDDTEESAVMYHTITITEIRAIDTSNRPKVISVQRLDDRNQTVSSAFLAEKIPSEPFDVRIVLSEKRKGIPDATKTADELAKDLVDIDGNEGVASNLVIGTPFARFAQGNEGDANNDPGSMIHLYLIRVKGCMNTRVMVH